MVAHPGLDVRILTLTCAVADAARNRWPSPRRHERPASPDRGRLLAAVCAKYAPKLQVATFDRELDMPTTWTSLVTLPLLLQLPQASTRAAALDRLRHSSYLEAARLDRKSP